MTASHPRGQGINRQLPHLGNRGQGIAEYLRGLSQRLESPGCL